ncbi:MAG: J domain-containing protein [Acidimicrobiales bacterium]
MDDAEARAVLGVGARAPAEDIRTAFRQRLHHAHPDVAPRDPEATRTTARLVEAYGVLRRGRSRVGDRPSPPSRWSHPDPGARVAVDGDHLAFAAPRREVYLRLFEVADQIGEVTYVDPDARLLDTVVILDDGTACSLLAVLQERLLPVGSPDSAGTGGAYRRGWPTWTEIYFTVEPLGGEARPPVAPLVAAVASLLGGR